MTISLILLIISFLLISNIQSLNNIKVYSYNNSVKSTDEKEIFYQDKIIKEGVDSYCRNNFDDCRINSESNSGIYSLTISNIASFIPSFNTVETNQYPNYGINTNTKSINLEISILDLEKRKNYLKHYLNKNENILCRNGVLLPCTGADDVLIKTYKYSEELQTLFIDYYIAQLQLKIDDENAKTTPDQTLIDQWNAEIDVFILEKNVLIDTINNRKLNGFY